MKRGKPLERRTPLRAGKPLERGKGLKRSGWIRTSGAVREPRPARESPDARKFRAAVRRRSGGRCEACPRLADTALPGTPETVAEATGLPLGYVTDVLHRAFTIARACDGQGVQAHHVQPRGMGGGGDNRPENGLYCCARSHAFLESFRTVAYALGLLARH